MEKIEIKYNKKGLLLVLTFFATSIIASTYLVFFTATFSTNPNIKFLIVPINLCALYMVVTLTKKLLDDISVITMSKNYIEINHNGRPLTFSWTEIKELKIEKRQTNKSEIDILVIKSDTRMEEVNISALDKSADEIGELIRNYRALING